MLNALPHVPKPDNSPFVSFMEGTKEKVALQNELARLRDPKRRLPVIPLWINGAVRTVWEKNCMVPHNMMRRLGSYSLAEEEQVKKAVQAVLNARERWS